MKKYWIVLLSLGLLAVFSIPAFAVDVKFSGSYYVRGWYDDNASMLKKTAANASANQGAVAFFDQRLRVQTDFKVAEGLVLTTRFDALEKKWGDTTGGLGGTSAAGGDSAGRTYLAGSKEQENIEFERAYLTFRTGIGAFMVGYQGFMAFGPDVANSSTSRAGIKYILPIGDLMIVAALEVAGEKAVAADLGKWSDTDNNAYDLGAIYKFKGGDAGLMYQYLVQKSGRTTTAMGLDLGNTIKLHLFDPYIRATFGPIYFEAEGLYVNGDAPIFDNDAQAKLAGQKNAKGEQLGFFAQLRVNLAPVYFGAYLGYASGDDLNTTDKVEGGFAKLLKAGSDYKPCLMLYNDDYATQFAGARGVASLGSYMDNIWFTQVYVGAKPTAKMDVKVSYSVAQNEKDAVKNAVSKNLGQEIDLTFAYKIYDNLEYMIGGAYFITGDAFKGISSTTEIDNDYLLMHKLTLSF